MVTRRSFLAGLATLPFLRWPKPAAAEPPPVVLNVRRQLFMGAEVERLWRKQVRLFSEA